MRFEFFGGGSILLMAILLAGCAGQQAAPGQVVSVNCNGSEWSSCYQQLSKRCGANGYELINQITDAGSSAMGNNDSLISGTVTRRSVVAKCKDN